MQPEISYSYKDIALLPVEVKALYEKHSIQIPPLSDLATMLKLCMDIDAKISSMDTGQRLEVCQAQRVLSTIINCSGETALAETLSRIAGNPLLPAYQKRSTGKDTVFELEFLAYIKHRGLTARLGEPDIIIDAPFGDYFAACKAINSLKNVEKQLGKGCSQVEKHGRGFVVFSFEPHIHFEQPLRGSHIRSITALLRERLRELQDEFTRIFDKKLYDGRLDGIVLQASCIADIAESYNELDVVTSTTYYSNPSLQPPEARDRFRGFSEAMLGPLGEMRMPVFIP